MFKTEPEELVAAVICGAVSATGAELVRRHGTVRVRPPNHRWLRTLPALPRLVIVDTGRLVSVLWRVVVRRERVTGRFLSRPFPGARARTPEAAARRAIAKLVGSVSPNTLVVGFAENDDRVLLHQLVPTDEPPRCDPWEPGW